MQIRQIAKVIKSEEGQYPVIAIVGPRQTGKTTLVRHLYPNHTYLLLENFDVKERAEKDPKAFFEQHKGNLILDEIQKAPKLISYLQGIVDVSNNTRHFVLTGSEQLLLSEKISQTLAGRSRTYYLLPFAANELKVEDLNKRFFKGSYPRIYDKNLKAQTWLAQYHATYVERDVRTLLNVSSLEDFQRVLSLVAGRVSQLLDYSSIANDAGVSNPTIKSWLSILKASFICFTLQPHFKNFNKRTIKSPKIFFYDTGLLCYLLRIQTEEQLSTHPLYGSIFENWVIAEKMKQVYHQGLVPSLYFWRDSKGREIDLIEDRGSKLMPIEIKSSQTFHSDFIKNINYFNELQGFKQGQVIYRGQESFSFKNCDIHSWKCLEEKP